MINAITNLSDIDVIIRDFIITQSEVKPEFVRNSASVFGTTLDKDYASNIFDSIDLDDTLILFDVKNRYNEGDMSQTQKDGMINLYRSFNVHIIVYGNNSKDVANTLIARFRTQKVRTDLQNQAIYLEKVSDLVEVHEFKSSILWVRNDFDINISCKIQINQIDDDYEPETISSLNIRNT